MTIHGALGLSVKGSQQKVSPKLQRLWVNKLMLIIDEVSIVSLQTLQEIEQQCRSIRNNNISWGGLKVILLCGDFYQFPPVKGRALWQKPTDSAELTSNHQGQQIWHSFSNCILLDEQMRQAEDIIYLDLLRRIRTGTTTFEDYSSLMQRVGQLDADGSTKVIVRSNQLRQHLNIKLTIEFAQTYNQPVYIFMASHHPTDESVPVDEWQSLAVVDRGSTSLGPGLFVFTKNIPIVINRNLYTSLGLVNGKEGNAIDAVLDSSSKVYQLPVNNASLKDSCIWIIDRPPKCLLVKISDPKFSQLDGLPEGILPLFPSTFKIEVSILQDLSPRQTTAIRRHQISCSAAFAITDYRSQSRTFNRVMLDFESANKQTEGGHRTFTAIYVALSRTRSISGLSFLRGFPQSTFLVKPDHRLEKEMNRLQALERRSLSIDYQAMLDASQEMLEVSEDMRNTS